jgi:hypothetical protein
MAKSFTEKAQEIVDSWGDDYSVYKEYSGRFMFGDRCLGIVGPDPSKIVERARRRGFKKAKTDNMGLDYIVYWPHIKG